MFRVFTLLPRSIRAARGCAGFILGGDWVWLGVLTFDARAHRLVLPHDMAPAQMKAGLVTDLPVWTSTFLASRPVCDGRLLGAGRLRSCEPLHLSVPRCNSRGERRAAGAASPSCITSAEFRRFVGATPDLLFSIARARSPCRRASINWQPNWTPHRTAGLDTVCLLRRAAIASTRIRSRPDAITRTPKATGRGRSDIACGRRFWLQLGHRRLLYDRGCAPWRCVGRHDHRPVPGWNRSIFAALRARASRGAQSAASMLESFEPLSRIMGFEITNNASHQRIVLRPFISWCTDRRGFPCPAFRVFFAR